MSSNVSTGDAGGSDIIGRVSRMSNRTNLMVIDATLHALPENGESYAKAADEIRALSGRMIQAVKEFQATLGLMAVESVDDGLSPPEETGGND